MIYLTEYPAWTKLGPAWMTGPRIHATNWDHALIRLEFMIAVYGWDENTEITGEWVEDIEDDRTDSIAGTW